MERPSYNRNIQALALRPRCNTAQYTGATPAFLSAIRHNCNRFFGRGVWRLVDLAAPMGPPAGTFQRRPPDGCGALQIAAGLHSALDGWSVSAANGSGHLGTPFVLAIAIHKIPEGLALGVIVRAAMDSRGAALGWCILAESATLAGAALEMVLAPHLGPRVLHALLAIAGGTFLYL